MDIVDTDATCPKCGAVSGDDWSECDKSCPFEGSPHYDPAVATVPPFNIQNITAGLFDGRN